MNVDDLARKRLQQRFLDDPHKAGQNNQFDICFEQESNNIFFDFRLEPGSKPARANIESWNLKIAGQAENTGVLYVGNDDAYFRIQAAVDDLFHDRAKIRSFSRTQHTQPQRTFHFPWIASMIFEVDFPGTNGRISIFAPISFSAATSTGSRLLRL